MNIIITGGAGFLGSELLNNLLQQFPQIETIKVVDRIKLDSNLITNNKVHFFKSHTNFTRVMSPS